MPKTDSSKVYVVSVRFTQKGVDWLRSALTIALEGGPIDQPYMLGFFENLEADLQKVKS
jgi:hypothetical protein